MKNKSYRPSFDFDFSSFRAFQTQFWIFILIGILTALPVAFFLASLEHISAFFHQHPNLLYLLPIAGILSVYIYRHFGKNAEKGTKLLLQEIQEPRETISPRMSPLILFSTLWFHLFGASVGREGTAVQISAGISEWVAQRFSLSPLQRKQLLYAGISAGFSAVFGTPLTAIVFAQEMVHPFRFRLSTLFWCTLSSLAAHLTCLFIGLKHTTYAPFLFSYASFFSSPYSIACLIGGGIIFGFTGYIYVNGLNQYRFLLQKISPSPYFHVVIGAGILLIFCALFPFGDYLGLGVKSYTPGSVSISSCFTGAAIPYYAFAIKLLFTLICIGSGMKGGEVTPLFFIGACLGNSIGSLSSTGPEILAACGFIAVFAAATKTPLACALMGAEIFGWNLFPLFLGITFLSFFASGKKSIYH